MTDRWFDGDKTSLGGSNDSLDRVKETTTSEKSIDKRIFPRKIDGWSK